MGGRGDRVGKLEQTNLHQLKCVGGGLDVEVLNC